MGEMIASDTAHQQGFDVVDGGPGDTGVYIHFPYCVQKCPYCDFNSYAERQDSLYQTYTDAVCRELRARLPELAGRRLRSIYFGGGTPSLWAPAAVHAVITQIAAFFGRARAEPLEITLEANPGAVEIGRLRDFKAAGVNRVSMGVQALGDGLLRTLGRVHDRAEALAALALIQSTGFASHSIDLIYGIPTQTLEQWKSALADTVSLATPHVSAYNLIYEPGTLMHRWRERGTLTPVDEVSEVAMFDAAREAFTKAGLVQYEVSNFARPTHASVHNQLYWQGRFYLGVGAGAHSFVPGRDGRAERRCTLSSPQAYVRYWREDRDSIDGGAFDMIEELDLMQRADEQILLGLRTLRGWDAAQTERECGVPALAAATEVARAKPEWCRFDGRHLAPTRTGLLMNNALIVTTASALANGDGQRRGQHGGLARQ